MLPETSVCEHCGVLDSEHGYEHLARECYPKQIERLRTHAVQLEAELKYAVECCSAFQHGGQFVHLVRLGERVFAGVPRLVAKLSN